METMYIVGTVFANLQPDFDLAYLRTHDGHQYVFNRNTPGIKLDSVKENQQYKCLVTIDVPKVLHAELIDEIVIKNTVRDVCKLINAWMQHNNPYDCPMVLDIKQRYGIEPNEGLELPNVSTGKLDSDN